MNVFRVTGTEKNGAYVEVTLSHDEDGIGVIEHAINSIYGARGGKSITEVVRQAKFKLHSLTQLPLDPRDFRSAQVKYHMSKEED